ncbi:MAG: hypothetical protein V1798_10460 [Pseudomonadota bacterium]
MQQLVGAGSFLVFGFLSGSALSQECVRPTNNQLTALVYHLDQNYSGAKDPKDLADAKHGIRDLSIREFGIFSDPYSADFFRTSLDSDLSKFALNLWISMCRLRALPNSSYFSLRRIINAAYREQNWTIGDLIDKLAGLYCS